jgi:hypothetical protein
MKPKIVYLWIFSILLTLGVAYFQRTTGPTYPVTKTITINGNDIRCKYKRAFGGDGDAVMKFKVADTSIQGFYRYKRLKSFDEWTEKPMAREGSELVCAIPHQPPAGKVIYSIYFVYKDIKYIPKESVIIRFRGDVPPWVLIPHIIFMFLSMLFSTRAGLEAIYRGKNTFRFAVITVITLFIGGAFLGPLVQKYAFDAYWTGWPIGHDLTDNKTAVALLFWLVAMIVMWRRKANRFWPVFAAIMLLLIYLIPHSVLGSELDYTKQTEITSGK